MLSKIKPWWTLRQLKSRDDLKRIRAAERLGSCKDEWVVEHLKTLLGDPDFTVRQFAAEILGQIGDARAVDALIACLGLPWLNRSDVDSAKVRQAALQAIVNIGGASTVEALRASLKTCKNWDTEVRDGAMEALKRINSPESRQALEDHRREQEAQQREEARRRDEKLREEAKQRAELDDTVVRNLAKYQKQWELDGFTAIISRKMVETLREGIAEIRERGSSRSDFSTPGWFTGEAEAALVAALVEADLKGKTWWCLEIGKDLHVGTSVTGLLFERVPITSGADLKSRISILRDMSGVIGADAFLAATKLLMAQATKEARGEVRVEEEEDDSNRVLCSKRGCGASILPATAKRYDGRCARHRR